MSIELTLYGRSYCHLCEDMLADLNAFRQAHTFTVTVIDVDQDEALCAQYDEWVPVLFGQKPGGERLRLCHHVLDPHTVARFFHD